MVTIRKAGDSGFDSIWRIFREVAAGGDTFTFDERERGLVDAFVMHRFL